MSDKVRADLAERLRGFGKPELEKAAQLLDEQAGRNLTVQQEEPLADRIWELVSQARDHHQFDDADELRMDALEAEMAGRTLAARIHINASR